MNPDKFNPSNLEGQLPNGPESFFNVPGEAAKRFDDLVVDMAKIRPGMMQAILTGEQIDSERDD